MWAIGPLVRMGPETKLEIHTAPRGLCCDELQCLQIPLALTRSERRLHMYLLKPGHLHKIGVREVEIVASNASRKIPPEPKRKIEPVESRGGDGVQIR